MTTISKRLAKPKPSIVFDLYWQFAALRQSVFFKRFNKEPFPWTDDKVLSKHKFTNAYRASDRVSQFLINDVIPDGENSPEEIFFRIILFKTFNKIETWQRLKQEAGTIVFANYSFKQYAKALGILKQNGQAIYSGAYMMASGKGPFGYKEKHKNHLALIKKMMTDNVPQRVSEAKDMKTVYQTLKKYPTIGSFLAYQYAIDINYSALTSFSEMDFVKAGPGAKDGIRKCFVGLGDYTEEDVIRWVADRQQDEFEKRGIKFQSLWGRPLQLIDCQNIFCEVDKYARVVQPNANGISKRKRIKQLFKPNFNEIKYRYPFDWGLNHKIEASHEQIQQHIYQPL